MSDAEKVIALAKTQVGVREQPPGSNNVIYNTDYYGGPVSGDQYPWCCAFIWWLFWKLGLSSEFCGGAKTAYCPFVVNFARQTGRWITNASYKPGDLFLYDWNGDGAADHIGLCVEWYGSFGTTIEGNSGDAVQELSRSHGTIMGAYRPAYGSDEDPQPDPSPAPDTDTYVVKEGDSLWAIAERLLGDGGRWIEIYELNHLPSTVIYPGQILKIPQSKVDPEPDPGPPPSIVQVDLPELGEGATGAAVGSLQVLLIVAGFDVGPDGADGDFGSNTWVALCDFQRQNSLPVSGRSDAPTWAALIG